MDLNSIILFFFLIGFSLFFYNYFPIFLKKSNFKFLIDDEFNKPQAFHQVPVSTSGGIGIFFSFLIVCFYLFLFENIIHYEYLSFCLLFFLLGLLVLDFLYF